MAVTIDRVALAKRLRIGQSATELEEVDNLLAEATEAVERFAPAASDTAHNLAVYRYAGYTYDRPFASADTRFSNVMRNSGAAAALLPYRVHRLGLSGGDDMDGAAGNGIIGLAIMGGNIVVTFADGSTENVPLPPSIGGVTVVNVIRTGDVLTVTYSDGNHGNRRPARKQRRQPTTGRGCNAVRPPDHRRHTRGRSELQRCWAYTYRGR